MWFFFLICFHLTGFRVIYIINCIASNDYDCQPRFCFSHFPKRKYSCFYSMNIRCFKLFARNFSEIIIRVKFCANVFFLPIPKYRDANMSKEHNHPFSCQQLITFGISRVSLYFFCSEVSQALIITLKIFFSNHNF